MRIVVGVTFPKIVGIVTLLLYHYHFVSFLPFLSLSGHFTFLSLQLKAWHHKNPLESLFPEKNTLSPNYQSFRPIVKISTLYFNDWLRNYQNEVKFLIFSLLFLLRLVFSFIIFATAFPMGLQGEIFVTQLFTKIKTNGKAVLYDERGSSLPRLQSKLSLQIGNVETIATLQGWQGCPVQEGRPY